MGSSKSREMVRIEVSDKKLEMEHFHQYIELCYVLQGRVEIEMGQECVVLFEEGVYLINANKKHSIRLSEDGLLVKVCISFELLSDILGSLDVQFICNSNMGDTEQYDALRKQIKRLLTHYVNTNGNIANFGHIALCYELLDVLAVNFQVRNSDKHNNPDDSINIRINQINNYVMGNYNGQLSLKDLADKLYLSEAYLSRFFKKTYGMSFLKYVTNIRVSHAYDSLLYTDEPITKIAYDNGFSTVALFNKTFKQMYGQTPSEARKQMEIEISEDEIKLDNKLQTKLEDFLRNGSSEYNEGLYNSDEVIACHQMQVYETLPQLKLGYRKAINGGCADDMMRAEVREHIATLADQLHFEFVRFWNIFTSAMLLSIDMGEEDYNFSKIDGIIDFLLQHNLKPAIDLGAKPKRIIKNISEPLVCEEDHNLSYDSEVWANLIEKFFQHLNDYYGAEEVGTWVFELWYDERADIIPEYDYFEIFNNTARIIRKINKRTRFGGSGIRDDRGREWITTFLKELRKQPEQPDYISMINFPYVSGEIKNDLYSRRSTDNDFLLHAIEMIRGCMNDAGFAKNMPLFVSEWNATLSDRNAINDSCYKGAFIIKNLVQTLDVVDGVGYFIATDRLMEYSDTKEMLFGGSGLITRDSIFKPSAFAFDFMYRLKPRILGKGKNYIITTDENGSMIIICHNQKKLNYNYFLTNEGDINKKELWKYFEDLDSLDIKFELSGLEDGDYKARIYRVNEEHGSILDLWKTLDFDKSLSRSDLRFCRRVCEPGLTISTVHAQDGVLKYQVTLKANEFACISLKKS